VHYVHNIEKLKNYEEEEKDSEKEEEGKNKIYNNL
jgi:hypothetical protein